MIIRQEKPEDYNEIRELVRTAFEYAEHTDGNEYLLVGKLRKSSGFIKELTLVAQDDNCIIGHIMFTQVIVGENVGLALAPLSVLPKSQKKGVGLSLMNTAHEIAKELGYKFSVVLGSEKYYPKVGYELASKYGVFPPFDVPDENYMVIFFDECDLNIKGTVEYVKEMLDE